MLGGILVRNTDLVELDLPSLSSVASAPGDMLGGWLVGLYVGDNQVLETLKFDSLQTCGSKGIMLTGTSALGSVTFTSLEVAGGLQFYDESLISCQLPVLQTVGNTLTFGGVLEEIEAPQLVTAVNITVGAAVLSICELPSLETMEGNLKIHGLPPAGAFSALTSVGGLTIQGQDGGDVEFPLLAEVSYGMSIGTLNLGLATELSSLSFPALVSVGELRLLGTSVGSVNLSLLEEIANGVLKIEGLTALQGLHFPTLGSVQTDVVVHANTLSSLSCPVLQTIGKSLDVSENDGMESLSLPLLESVGESLDIVSNGQLFGLELDALFEVKKQLSIYWNSVLPACAVEELLSQLEPPPPWGVSVYGNDDEAVCE